MHIDDKGIALIKSFEGCKLTAYPDTDGVPTIGFGHTTGVTAGQCITESQATDFLRKDLAEAEMAVNNRVKVPLTQNQFSALVSFTFNVGSGNFGKSTLLKLINSRQYGAAANEFAKWDHAGGVAVPGILRRRLAERDLFLTTA